MFNLTIGSISQNYDDMDSAIADCFEIFPDAHFSSWNDSRSEVWQDIFKSYTDRTIVGKITEC